MFVTKAALFFKLNDLNLHVNWAVHYINTTYEMRTKPKNRSRKVVAFKQQESLNEAVMNVEM